MDPYLGEIRMFGGNFAPQGWAMCDGSLLSITDNPPLFTLLDTTYGGDGQNTFALPDLRSRIPIHRGTNPTSNTTYNLGQAGGSESITLTTPQMAEHSHTAIAITNTGEQASPEGAVWASSSLNQFSKLPPNAAMATNAVDAVGQNQPHDNMMPSLAINFIICTDGLFPPQG